jgi:ribonuclease HI
MRFKGERVFVKADESGKPELDGAGRAEMKYRETDNKSYRPSAGNLSPDDDASAPSPSSSRSSFSSSSSPSSSPSSFLSASSSPSSPRPKAKAKAAAAGGPALELWTDGACSGNPGPMGIGVVAIDGGKRRELGEYLGIGTNNIAELTAIDRALDLAAGELGKRPVRIYTDSAYSIGVLSKNWKAKANQELIARMRRRLAGLPQIEFVKVSGHAGVPENERCDELARDAITGRR